MLSWDIYILHCTDEAQKAETVLSAVIYIYIYIYIYIADNNCARSLVLWSEHCGMTELYHMRGTLEVVL